MLKKGGIEMSFVEEENVMSLVENLIAEIFKEIKGIKNH